MWASIFSEWNGTKNRNSTWEKNWDINILWLSPRRDSRSKMFRQIAIHSKEVGSAGTLEGATDQQIWEIKKGRDGDIFMSDGNGVPFLSQKQPSKGNFVVSLSYLGPRASGLSVNADLNLQKATTYLQYGQFSLLTNFPFPYLSNKPSWLFFYFGRGGGRCLIFIYLRLIYCVSLQGHEASSQF